MPLGEAPLSNYFPRKKENHKPQKRKRSDASTTIATGLPSPKRQKQTKSANSRRKALNNKDGHVNRPSTASSHSNLLALSGSTPPTHVKALFAASYPTPKSIAKHNSTRRESSVIDLTNDDDQLSPSPSLSIRSPLQRRSLATPKTPVRRRRVLSEIVPETPTHTLSPVRLSHPSAPSLKSTAQSISDEKSELPTSLVSIAGSSQPREPEITSSELQPFPKAKSSHPRGPADVTTIPSSQSQEQEFDPSYFVDLRAKRLAPEEQEIVPSSQSQSQLQYWSREENDHDKETENQGKDLDDLGSSNPSPDMPFPSSNLQRTESNVSFIVPVEDIDISSLFEEDPTFLAAQDDTVGDIPLSKPLSQAVSATESDSGDENWLQKVGNRAAVGHAISQQLSPPRPMHHSQRTIEPKRTYVASRSCTPEWPSQLTLAGCDAESSQWSLPPDATDFLDARSSFRLS